MHIRAALHAEKIAKEKGCKEIYVGQDGCYRGCIKHTYLIGDTYYKFNESGVLLISYPSKAAVLQRLQSTEVKIGVIRRGKSEIIDY